ncbi:MAG TPA: AAA family ATPase, partial [Anaerolineales bacterium]|nr:AAA family ATPase [Anaerolineales bacterium]
MYCGLPARPRTADDDARHARLAAATPLVLAEKARAALEGERRVVTVLFADVVGSTAMLELHGLQTWTGLINAALERITPAVYRYEGTIASLLGDAMLAFFGAPVAHEDDPLRAIRAALEALESIQPFAEQVRREHGLDFAMRFCLNTGPVAVGAVGSELKYTYTDLGGVVNLASRLKFAARPMTVLISEETHRFAAPVFDCSDLGLIDVRNRQEPVRVYQVQGLKLRPDRTRGLAGLESPLVGREAELSALIRLSEAVRAGLGRAVLVSGEPGLGKTRLIAEWKAMILTPSHAEEALLRPAYLHAASHVAGRSETQARSSWAPTFNWAEGRCLSYKHGIAYRLVIDLLRSLLGLSDGASEQEVHTALLASIRDLFGEGPDSPANKVYPYLAHLLALRLEAIAQERIDPLDPQALQAQYLASLRKYLQALAARRPLVLVIEDLHWADPSSAEMLTRILPLVFTSPILICLVSRPERDSPGWKLVSAARETLGGSLAELALEALSEHDSRQLISNLLEIEALPESVRLAILAKSEGNPLFVEEIIRMLIERGVIVREQSGWVASGRLEVFEIPDNLQSLLLARIDRLPEEARLTLRIASVVGRQFPVKILEQVLEEGWQPVTPQDEHHLGALSALESAGLIRIAKVEPDLEYLFRHTLVQEAAYASLLVDDRKRLHRSVGEAVERIYPDRLDSHDLAPRLGQHFCEAGDDERALKYYTLAGEAALAFYANQEAEEYYRQALCLACTDEERPLLLAGLGEALARQSRYEEALLVWREGLSQYQALGDLESMARLYARSARATWWAGDTPGSLRLCQEGLEATAGALESLNLALLIHEAARAYHFNGIPEKALPLCRQALEMAERLGFIEVQADALATVGILKLVSPEEALAALTRSAELAEDYGLLIIATRAHINLGSEKRKVSGLTAEANQHFARAYAISQQRGVPQEQFFTLVNLAGISCEAGDFTEVEAAIPVLESLADMLLDPGQARSEIRFLRALLIGYRGSWEEALSLMNSCLEVARKRGNLQLELYLLNSMVSGMLELGDWEKPVDWAEAEAAARQAVELGQRGLGDFHWPLCLLSMVLSRQGRLEEAHQKFEVAKQTLTDEPSIYNTLTLNWVEANLAVAATRWEAALKAYETCLGELEHLNQRWHHARLLLVWGETLIKRGDSNDLEKAQALLGEAEAKFVELAAAQYVQRVQAQVNRLKARTYAEVAAHQEAWRELAQARRAQESFMPEAIPDLPGWDLAARLEPARQTSGDYYDFISLPGGQMGIVVADVADKGAAAALFMASSRTLLRAYSGEFPQEPERVLEVVNRRLLSDTHAGLFITSVYAIVDPDTGAL